MHEYIARLIRAGMPRRVAVMVCSYYHERGKTKELSRYVEVVERESYGKVGDVE